MLIFYPICFKSKGNRMLQTELKGQLSIPFFSQPLQRNLSPKHTMQPSLKYSACLWNPCRWCPLQHILWQLVFPRKTVFQIYSQWYKKKKKRYRSFIITSSCFVFCVYTGVCKLTSRLFPFFAVTVTEWLLSFRFFFGKVRKSLSRGL